MGVLTAFCASYGRCRIPATGPCGSVDGCVCLLQEVYMGVLMALSVTGGVHGSTDGSVCYRRCTWEY